MLDIFVSPSTIAALDRRSKAVREIIKDGSDRRRVLKQIKEEQNERWDRNLDAEGEEYGGWAALAEATLEDRVMRGFGPSPILRREGTLHSNVRAQAEGAHVRAASVTWALSDTGDSFPATHWAGYMNVRGGATPARKV